MEEVALDPSEFRMRRESPRLQPGWVDRWVRIFRDLPPLTLRISSVAGPWPSRPLS